MNFLSAVVVLVVSSFLSNVNAADFLKDLASAHGWDMGNGLSLHLERIASNDPKDFFQSHILRFQLNNGYGFTIGKAVTKPAVQFGFFSTNNDIEEGREKKDNVVSMIMGYKMATIVSMILGGMGALVLKALGLAKIALVTSVILFIAKLFHQGHHAHHQHAPAYVEIEHAPEHAEAAHPEVLAASGVGLGGTYHPSGAENYYSYANYIPSGLGGENAMNYGNLDEVADNVTNAGRRRDFGKRKNSKIPLYTIHRYTVET